MSVSLIKQIAVGLIVGICIACFAPGFIPVASIFGDFFVKALKGVAPVLVFFLVMNAMLQKKNDRNASIKPVIMLYFITTFLAFGRVFTLALHRMNSSSVYSHRRSRRQANWSA